MNAHYDTDAAIARTRASIERLSDEMIAATQDPVARSSLVCQKTFRLAFLEVDRVMFDLINNGHDRQTVFRALAILLGDQIVAGGTNAGEGFFVDIVSAMHARKNAAEGDPNMGSTRVEPVQGGHA